MIGWGRDSLSFFKFLNCLGPRERRTKIRQRACNGSGVDAKQNNKKTV